MSSRKKRSDDGDVEDKDDANDDAEAEAPTLEEADEAVTESQQTPPKASAAASVPDPSSRPPSSDQAVLSPNALHRLLLSIGLPGQILSVFLLLLTELIHTYLPMVESFLFWIMRSLRL
uniref:Uncharacterized protein n=1 Tax=Odontella aurita TaxID=265563 RepID=A0A7S4NAV4_9STRA|mmetsp:Transcript_54902/g.164374  ORF Transcript_54902/g.164374 Transcript_54902/m.164374 type:complete len:119 (+) Transcript_54902:151-507(+)